MQEKNKEGYRDPTASKAVRAARREEKEKERRQRKSRNDAKKSFLRQYHEIMLQIKDLQDQERSLREVSMSAKAQQLSDMPKGSAVKSDLSDVLVRYERVQKKIQEKLYEAMEKRLEIEDAILNISDAKAAAVLRLRYIEMQKWEKIASKLGYSVKQIHRIHGKGLDLFEKNAKK